MMIARYTIIIAILAAYAGWGLFAISTQNVSAAYRSYYVDRNGEPWLYTDSAKPYRFGQFIDPTQQDGGIFTRGWFNTEWFGRWTNGSQALLQIEREDTAYAGPVCLTLRGHFAGEGEGRAKVQLILDESAEIDLDPAHFDPSPARLEFLIRQGEQLDIRFQIENPHNPKRLNLSDDDRDLGFGLTMMLIEDLPCRSDPLAAFTRG